MNLIKIASVIDLFRKGNEISNPEVWKNRQVAGTVLGAVIVAGANTATAFGYPVPVDVDTANTIAVGVISAFNMVMTYITTKKIGLPEKVERTDEEETIVQDIPKVEPHPRLKVDDILEYCSKNLLIPFEGTGPVDKEGNFLAYIDPVGIPTVAWGITFDEKGNKIKLGDKWSWHRAVEHKQNILKTFLNDLYCTSPTLKDESVRRTAGVLSWVYNLGIGNYKSSTFKKKIDLKDWVAAASECKKWDKARVKGVPTVLKGLTKRRAAEADCILDK